MFDNPVFVVILLVVVAALGAAAGFFAGRSKGQEMARDAKTADLNEAKAQIEADRQEISELSTAVTQYRTQAEGLAQQLTYLKSQLAQAQRAERNEWSESVSGPRPKRNASRPKTSGNCRNKARYCPR